MDIQKYNYMGNENIGFHATVSCSQVIFPPEFSRENFFGVDRKVETYINRTRLIGLFTAGNSNCILIPEETTEREIQKLNEAEVRFEILETADNALGNLILCNDSGAVISEKISDRKGKIEEALSVPVQVGSIAGIKNPGVCGITNGKGAVLHREASEEEARKVKEALDLEDVNVGTVNLGSPYTGSGALCSGERVLVGENTSGPEIGRIDRTLG